MKKWLAEDWQFELTVTEGKAEHCRLRIEKGFDSFFLMNVLRVSAPE